MTLDIIAEAMAAQGFPFFAVDLGDLAEALQDARAADGTALLLKIEGVLPDRKPTVVAAFSRLMQTIHVPKKVRNLIAQSHLLDKELGLAALFLALSNEDEPKYKMSISIDGVFWEEESPWPAAYNGCLLQLRNLTALRGLSVQAQYKAFAKTLNAQGLDASNAPIADQISRVLPTSSHYAAGSLGAWGGGTINMQFLGFYAALSQLLDSSTNDAAARMVGYDQDSAEALTASGLIAVPQKIVSEVVDAQGDDGSYVFGGIQIDEWNTVNFPDLKSDPPGSALSGLLFDKHYRAAFRPRIFGNQALYGAKNVLQDHYKDFYKSVGLAQLIRCKHYCAPVIEVSDPSELAEIASTIPSRSDEGVFYRGQPSFFPLTRHERVKPLLFGSSESLEPSLNTQATSRSFDYDNLHFALRYFIQDQVVFGPDRDEPYADRRRRWKDKTRSPLCELDYAIMALGQHYGIPTHGLDVTSDIDVATWFATNLYSKPLDIASYQKKTIQEWGENPKDWPVIFACQQVTWSPGQSLQKCRELSEFGLTALRPERQKASFFHGGQGDHQNRLAETVVCVFRLKPGPWATSSSFAELFPTPERDPAYRMMLAFAHTPAYTELGAREVTKFGQL